MILLVGPDGRVWNPYSYEFVRYLGYFGGDQNLVSYATRNLGFAAVAMFPRYSRIRIQPSLFPAACLEKVVEILIYRDPPRFVIERAGLSFAPVEIIPNLNDAVARLQALQLATPEEDVDPSSPNIIGLSLPRLSHPKRAAMRAALRAWKAAHGYTASRDMQKAAQNPLFGGGAVAWMPGGDRCLIEAWPSSYQRYGDNTNEIYLGRDVREHPDVKYMLPTTRAYFTAAYHQAPRLELIEAMVTHQDGSRFWSRYERLVLPWRTRSSDCFVSSVPMVRLIRRC